LLEAFAGPRPRGGESGILIDYNQGRGIAEALDHRDSGIDQLLSFDAFRRTLQQASSRQDIWPILVLFANSLFFADIFVRRVRLDFAWASHFSAALVGRLRGRQLVPEVTTLNRLKGRKAEVVDSFESRRAAVHFEPSAESIASATSVTKEPVMPSSVPQPAASMPDA
jgi:hypothetical protein